ncbi:hypothetical protein BU26DRAFT_561043 [Trematosphaeria pertusa]|uniref:Uncharacterized protein n=1 Tax=Trematosphaeria pertusa TaxID=390896 RepID=A0A6A6IU95_9PLEO|nr:uncharacterized protein BU26DRAFT_561043 [Trematosphaeria pertusa]KAF2253768.1 hypothetical protein BU26DRAFT_561043 [Trematosphaeria pertusa]
MTTYTKYIHPFRYLLTSLHFDLYLEPFPAASPGLRNFCSSAHGDLYSIRHSISRSSDDTAVATTLTLLDMVVRQDVDAKIQMYQDLRTKKALNFYEVPPEECSKAVRSCLFESFNTPVSSKMFVLLGLLVTPKEERVAWIEDVGAWLAMSNTYEERGKVLYEEWKRQS